MWWNNPKTCQWVLPVNGVHAKVIHPLPKCYTDPRFTMYPKSLQLVRSVFALNNEDEDNASWTSPDLMTALMLLKLLCCKERGYEYILIAPSECIEFCFESFCRKMQRQKLCYGKVLQGRAGNTNDTGIWTKVLVLVKPVPTISGALEKRYLTSVKKKVIKYEKAL